MTYECNLLTAIDYDRLGCFPWFLRSGHSLPCPCSRCFARAKQMAAFLQWSVFLQFWHQNWFSSESPEQIFLKSSESVSLNDSTSHQIPFARTCRLLSGALQPMKWWQLSAEYPGATFVYLSPPCCRVCTCGCPDAVRQLGFEHLSCD